MQGLLKGADASFGMLEETGACFRLVGDTTGIQRLNLQNRILHRIGRSTEFQRGSIMFAITGVTGKVGGAVARSLLTQGQKVRAVVRDAEKGRSWSAQG